MTVQAVVLSSSHRSSPVTPFGTHGKCDRSTLGEILLRKKKKLMAEPIRTSVFPLDNGVVKIRVDETLGKGEYCLTPNQSNAVYCFAVY